MALLSDIITPTNVVAVAPGANGNVLQSNGTAWTSAALSVGISNIATATGNTTLTSTPTLLRITPTGYGTTVTLPDATTMTAGAGKFTVQNLSEYHVRIVNASNTLLGFVDAFKTVNIDLASASTSAGTWTLNNAVRLGVSAYYAESTGLITSFGGNDVRVLELDSDRQFYVFGSSSNLLYGQVYNQTTNTFGSPTLIRNTANVFANAGIALINANSVLVVSLVSNAAQAVVLSISGTTITVNTATTTTSSATLSSFQFFRAIPNGGFIYGYYGSGFNQLQLIPVSVSGTTPSFGTEVAAGGSLPSGTVYAQTTTDKLIVFMVDDSTGNGGFQAFSLSGNTITSGTRVNTSVSATGGTRFVKLTDTTYFFGCHTASNAYVGVISLSGLTITRYISGAIGGAGSTVGDSITISSTKVFFVLSSLYYNILTYTGSSVTLGTAITAAPGVVSSVCHRIKGNELAVSNSGTLIIVDISGASPQIKSSSVLGSNFLPSGSSEYDGNSSTLRTDDLIVSGLSQFPSTFQTALAFYSAVTLNNVGTPTISSFRSYSSNQRSPYGNSKMGFSVIVTSSTWSVLRKIELV
jgi:hypothetical protein